MKLFASLVSNDERLCAYFTDLKAKAFPPQALDRSVYKGKNVEVSTLGVARRLASDEIARNLLGVARGADCFMLLADRGCSDLLERVRSAPLVCEFDSSQIKQSPRNFINALTGRALRSLAVVLAYKDEELTRLPLRNFTAPDLAELSQCCREHADADAFGEDFERLISQLKLRVRPRRQSSFSTKYAVDDEKKFFVYGKERHARFATNVPHSGYCELQGIFRFGSKVERERHFNVSTGEGDRTSIAGTFPDCHDQQHPVAKTTHLNMFCNDFF